MLNCKQYSLNQVKVHSPRLLNQPVRKFSVTQEGNSEKIFDFKSFETVQNLGKVKKNQRFEINCLSTIGLVDTNYRQLDRVRKVGIFFVDISFVIT